MHFLTPPLLLTPPRYTLFPTSFLFFYFYNPESSLRYPYTHGCGPDYMSLNSSLLAIRPCSFLSPFIHSFPSCFLPSIHPYFILQSFHLFICLPFLPSLYSLIPLPSLSLCLFLLHLDVGTGLKHNTQTLD